GVLFGVTLVRNYNRQITVKEQAAKAWSMIDVSLHRRAELLPDLARVAEAYAGHERDVLIAVAGLRVDHGLPIHQELPAEQALVSAETSDRGQRAAAAGAFALTEAHPRLKADAVFVDLQRRIVDSEESVASARTFYNDAINVLRDRRQQFPGNLFARLVEVPSWRLFEAEEMALTVPPVAVAPARPDEDDRRVPTGPTAATVAREFGAPAPATQDTERPEGPPPSGGSAF
ncbi:MAG: LemA family protein, partial [Acidimicrobiia bacterium]|nr:LemA family protein [Acidimicrobiia bacterium]